MNDTTKKAVGIIIGVFWGAAFFFAGIMVFMNIDHLSDWIMGEGVAVSPQMQPVEIAYTQESAERTLRVYEPVWYGTFDNGKRGYIQADWDFPGALPEEFSERIIHPATGDLLCSVTFRPSDETTLYANADETLEGIMDKTSFVKLRQSVARECGRCTATECEQCEALDCAQNGAKRTVFVDKNTVSIRFIVHR